MSNYQLFLDTETFSECPIPNGTFAYAGHPSTEIIMWQWAIDNGAVQIADADGDISELKRALADPQCEIVCHNSAFDRTVMRLVAGFDIPVSRWFDTMACAMAHSLPGALGTLCEILEVPTDQTKDKAGKALIQLFCKPRPKNMKLRRATRETHPAEWQRFREYGGLDVGALREVYKRLPRWNYRGAERALWELDQRINDRGVLMDLDLARAAIRAMASAKTVFDSDISGWTGGAVTSAGQRDKLLAHALEAYGVLLPDLKSSTLERRTDDPDLPAELRELLTLRLEASKTSVSKYKRVLSGVSTDCRLRGLLAFCGALRTGRWAGRLFQPQNLPRPTLSNFLIERGIEALKADAEDLV